MAFDLLRLVRLQFLDGLIIRLFVYRFGYLTGGKMKDLFGLLDSIHEAFSRPEYQPEVKKDDKGNVIDTVTHCNQFTSEVVTGRGFKGLEGLLANQIIDLISKHEQWSEVAFEKAQDLANGGSLIILGTHGEPHGHVAVACPGKPKTSGRWGQVPTVASVGKQNMIRGANWVFSDAPKCWAYRPSL